MSSNAWAEHVGAVQNQQKAEHFLSKNKTLGEVSQIEKYISNSNFSFFQLFGSEGILDMNLAHLDRLNCIHISEALVEQGIDDLMRWELDWWSIYWIG